MGVATLGFKDGPSIRFRIDPQEIQWQFAIETNVTETLGGRVLQIVGATVGNITIRGEFGEDRTIKDGNGQSWLLADAFASKIKQMMAFQSSRNNTSGKRTEDPAIFAYPPRDWRFKVYVVSINDTDGGASVNFRTGKFSHGYELQLFIVEDLSPSTANVGSNRGVIPTKAAEAINAYINRITDGIGWKQTEFNGPLASSSTASGAANTDNSTTDSNTNPSSTDPTPTNPTTPNNGPRRRAL